MATGSRDRATGARSFQVLIHFLIYVHYAMHTEMIQPVERKQLFVGSCVALIATSVAFATVGGIMLALKREFILTNAEVGYIGGAALWGFAVSQFAFSPLVDTLGFRALLRLSFVGHLAGTLIMIFAGGFWTLFTGALVIAMANGLVEGACNPLVATLYPENKTVRLNQFHVWFPGGIVIGGLSIWLLDLAGVTAWEFKLILILIPTLGYGVLLLTKTFPPSENVQAGVSVGEMFRATFTTPLYLLLLGCIVITASTELGPNRWVPAVLEAGGLPGILVLAYINGLMALMRYKAGVAVHRLTPTGVLFGSVILAAAGLYWLSFAESLIMAILAATVFAMGVCYVWPTILGVVSERIPRSGAVGLGLMSAAGMLAVGLFTSPQMGEIADRYAHQVLPQQETVRVLQHTRDVYTEALDQVVPEVRSDVRFTLQRIEETLSLYAATGSLPEITTANALRAIIDSETALETAGIADSGTPAAQAGAIIGPADNYGGRMSFRWIVPFTCITIVVFGALYFKEKKSGGYRVRSITENPSGVPV